ncbi:PAS domain-containing protein [Pyruvatibacter sp.]|uniref:PAS domain-containing protein n=1 Tax=Pyruvatibacter sp. TaxID=1981328 RepID=UPI0032EAA28F
MSELRLANANKALLARWHAGREGLHLPRLPGSYFSKHDKTAAHVAIEARTSDGQVRIAYAGDAITMLMGVDLTGTSCISAFGAEGCDDLQNLLAHRWLTPVIVHSTSNVPTYDGGLVQLEFLKLPFMVKSMTALAYVVGIVKTASDYEADSGATAPDGKTVLRVAGQMKDRTTLLRDLHDPITLQKISTPLSIPPHNAMPSLLAHVADHSASKAG